jgi:hypothetical protein
VSAADYVDEACAALGGEDSDFLIRGIPGIQGAPYSIGLFCRSCGEDPDYHGPERVGVGLYSVGQMELWELVADARDHFEREHAVPAGGPQ